MQYCNIALNEFVASQAQINAPTGFFRGVATKKILNYRVSRHFFVILHSNTLKQR